MEVSMSPQSESRLNKETSRGILHSYGFRRDLPGGPLQGGGRILG